MYHEIVFIKNFVKYGNLSTCDQFSLNKMKIFINIAKSTSTSTQRIYLLEKNAGWAQNRIRGEGENPGNGLRGGLETYGRGKSVKEQRKEKKQFW